MDLLRGSHKIMQIMPAFSSLHAYRWIPPDDHTPLTESGRHRYYHDVFALAYIAGHFAVHTAATLTRMHR